VFTHASWTENRAVSYTRLAFLGDSVLGLAVTAHLYPRLEAERYGAGRLTKIRAQTVSGASCRAVAERLDVPERLRVNAPDGVGQSATILVSTERVLASVLEAVIGACFLHAGYERTADAVVEAFGPEISQALDHPVDFKSTLQERLAQRGEIFAYAVTAALYPRLEAERYGAGRLTKIRAQTVSGPSCRAVAERLEVPGELAAAAPQGIGQKASTLVTTERVLASVTEAIIGACFLHAGYERTVEAVVEAFEPEIEDALEHPVDFKSTLQERLAQRGDIVEYEVTAELGPPHDRTFQVVARVGERTVGRGTGRSKKHAEQEAARAALDDLDAAGTEVA